MKYVGVDLHKKIIVLCVMDKEQKILQRMTLHCSEPAKVRTYFAGLGPAKVVVEATAGYEWFAEMLDELKIEVVLAHPGKMRVIAESVQKSDKLDAEILARFLVLGMIPLAYRPTKRQREHRVLVRHRVAVRQQCSRIKCMVRRVLSNYNLDRRDAFSVSGREWLKELDLPSVDRFVLTQLLGDLDHMEAQLAKAKEQLRTFANGGDKAEKRAREVLVSAPGVGEVVSEVVLAELADVSRFASIDQAPAYAGLVPGQRESAGKAKALGITKKGSRLLRWAMVEAAWQSIRVSRRWERQYATLKKRCGAKRAIVALARRLLRVLTSMWRSGQTYRWGVNERIGGAKSKAAKTAKASQAEDAQTESAKAKDAEGEKAKAGKAKARKAASRPKAAVDVK